MGAEGEGAFDLCELGFGQPKIPGRGIFGSVLRTGSFGDREERRLPDQELERNLTRCRPVRGGDFR